MAKRKKEEPYMSVIITQSEKVGYDSQEEYEAVIGSWMEMMIKKYGTEKETKRTTSIHSFNRGIIDIKLQTS